VCYLKRHAMPVLLRRHAKSGIHASSGAAFMPAAWVPGGTRSLQQNRHRVACH